ncbi:MAG TPA: MXAN_5187 C-terminal domain-containing protein [Candidatus Xenobia bacterium]|nr:MXAN_5187 C-terminal domain-containing protein [Candidatus Xenobia bacterium]
MPTPDEELSQLEKDLRQLQIEYETYFAGGRKRPPNETEWRVQTAIKKWADAGGKLKYAQIFRYNSLASKYAKFSEIWRQRAKKVEEGRSAYGYSKVARELEQQRLAEAERRHEARIHGTTATRVAFSDPVKEGEKVQELYRSMLEAKKVAGEKGDINFEQFHKFVRQKTEQLRQQMGCKEVEYSISVEGGQVKLKAKGL